MQLFLPIRSAFLYGAERAVTLFNYKSIVSQFFGENKVELYKELGMKGHDGIDFVPKPKTPIYASHVGRAHVYWNKYGGNCVELIGEGFSTLYGHLDTVTVSEGEEVTPADIIGTVGSTGLGSTGPHLHWALLPHVSATFEVEVKEGYNGCIDPLPFLAVAEKLGVAIIDDTYNLISPTGELMPIGDEPTLHTLITRGFVDGSPSPEFVVEKPCLYVVNEK